MTKETIKINESRHITSNNKIIFKSCDMSQHDLVSAQTSNVCITHHAALNAIACMCQQIVMSETGSL